MKSIKNAQQELNALKNDVIGLFKVRDKFELVVDFQTVNNTVDTLNITEFGAIQINYNVNTDFGKYKLFPDNKNLNDMLDNPFEFDAFIKSFS